MQLLMTEADYGLVGMRPAVGRLANAMIAALGPELRRGSPAYNQCRAIIREMQVGRLVLFMLGCRWLCAGGAHCSSAITLTTSAAPSSMQCRP